MALSAGTRLGAYEITGELGIGGMGEVYRATDTKLDREVAIKVLPETFAQDAERMARFEREAKVLASLNHYGIASIYDLEDSGDTRALVMELVEGPTLADRIRSGPLPLDEALPVAGEMAEAIEYAHEHSIIHRDLKPANVKLTSEGAVKVLDFGLAKALEGDAAASATDMTDSPISLQMATRAGVLLGTTAYMSPEQAKGKSVDRRADIWAFGCVLYEMLTGQMAFVGETETDTLASVLKQEPDWSQLPATTPPRIRALLHRCLEKDVKKRLQAIGEARIVIESVLSGVPGDSLSGGIATNRQALLPWGLVTLFLIAVASISSLVTYEVSARRTAPESLQMLRTNIDLPPNVRLGATDPAALGTAVVGATGGATLAVSPNGTKLVMVGRHDGQTELYLRSVDRAQTRPIAGTTGAQGPFFSPDGQRIGFWADGHLKTLSLAAGGPSVVCAATTESGAAWLPDDTIVFSDGFRLQRVSADGGDPQPITALDASQLEGRHMSPVALPGGKAVLFEILYNGGQRSVALLSLKNRKRKVLVPGAHQPRFMRPGFVLVNRGGTLEAAPFDVARLKLTAPFAPLGESAPTARGAAVVSYDVAAAGRSLAYVKGLSTTAERGLYSVDLHGKAELLSTVRKAYWSPAVSPQGSKLAVTVLIDKRVDEVWVLDLARKTWLRLTSDHNDWQPIWKDDQTLLYYRGARRGGAGWEEDALSVHGNGTPERLASSARMGGSIALAPNHQAAVFTTRGPSSADLWIKPFAPGAKSRPLITTPADESATTQGFSPDGRWLAYVSDATGRREVYVTDFPVGSARFRVSRAGGTFPCWSRDGRQIFYWQGNTMMAVAVQSGAKFATRGAPHALFVAPFAPFNQFDVAPDGKHFYVTGYETIPTSPIVFVSDMTADLQSRASTR